MSKVISQLYRSLMLRFIARRILQTIPILFLVTFLVFLLLNILPGGTVDALLGENATPRLVKALTIRLGLNHPLFTRYFDWLRLALHGNFGTSLTNNIPVAHTIAQRLPVSAEIGGLAFFFSLLMAVPVAVLAAKKPHGVLDRLNIFVSMVGISLPPFVTALLLIIVFALKLHWSPALGFTPISDGLWSNLHTVALPAISIAFGIFCGYSRILRADLIDQVNSEDYIVMAKAKGISAWACLVRHALRNAVFNLVTVAVLNIGAIVGGAVLIESIFAVPGMGLLLIQSITDRDVVTVQAEVTIIACAVVAANLLADVIYALLDPRIRYGSAR
jgi:peptide/nickel transport system permease protein